MKPSIAGYCYICRGAEYDLPFEAAINLFTHLCDVVVVLTNPRFKDGTLRRLNELASTLGNLHAIFFTWQLDHPGMDGMTKAEAREHAAKIGADVLVLFDADEVLYEADVLKLRVVAGEMMRIGLRDEFIDDAPLLADARMKCGLREKDLVNAVLQQRIGEMYSMPQDHPGG